MILSLKAFRAKELEANLHSQKLTSSKASLYSSSPSANLLASSLNILTEESIQA